MAISEHDWKIFRSLLPEWQEQYMKRLMEEYMEILQSELDSSYKFWTLEKRIKQDKKSPGVLLEVRRSNTEENLISLVVEGVITLEDLRVFSDKLRETVENIVKNIEKSA